VVLFAVLCLVVPALLSMRPRQEIAAGGATWAPTDVHLKTPALTFADVGGLEESKKQIRDLVQANLNGKKFGEYGVFRNGILLHGPRGTGKTFLAEATAGEFGLKYCYISASGVVAKYIGDTVRNIDSLFESAGSHRPALLFIDEIDAVGTKRQQLGEADDTGGAARAYNSYTTRLMARIDEAHDQTGRVDSIYIFGSIYPMTKRGLGSLGPNWRSGHRGILTSSRSRREHPDGARPKSARSWTALLSLPPKNRERLKNATWREL
jgi:SpoVK/Ycf46/Vps4 family AAA+-type ATPase